MTYNHWLRTISTSGWGGRKPLRLQNDDNIRGEADESRHPVSRRHEDLQHGSGSEYPSLGQRGMGWSKTTAKTRSQISQGQHRTRCFGQRATADTSARWEPSSNRAVSSFASCEEATGTKRMECNQAPESTDRRTSLPSLESARVPLVEFRRDNPLLRHPVGLGGRKKHDGFRHDVWVKQRSLESCL